MAGGGLPLRVFTGSGPQPEMPPRFKQIAMNRRGPVWNNTGDTAWIDNPSGQNLDTYIYVSSVPAGGLPPGTHYQQPPAKHRLGTSTIYVPPDRDWVSTDITVEDGDVLNFMADGYIWVGQGLQGGSGPSGRSAEIAPVDWPLVGTPIYGLTDAGGGRCGECRCQAACE